jgi:lipopolysaccharide transport system permease protein
LIFWEYRELIRNLTIAELKNRYQNTSLGLLWSLLTPFMMVLVLWFVFKNLFKQEENYALNLIVGIMVWRFFSTGTSFSLNSIVSKPGLITKLYLPRQILVLSSALSNLIGSLLEFIILIPVVFFFLGHIPLTFGLYIFAHFVLFISIYGIGLLFSAIYVYFRDLAQIWEVLLSVLIYTCPIIYPISVVPNNLLPYYMLNPLTHMVLIYRDIMVKGVLPSPVSLLIVLAFGILSLLIGNFIFNKLQKRFAEEI